jgi:hypothetical protein
LADFNQRAVFIAETAHQVAKNAALS